MSGRELSFDQNVVLDLNRHLRSATLRDASESVSRSVASPVERPDISGLVEAVSLAAASISQKDAQIQLLEDRHHEFETAIERMKSKLGDLVRLQQSSEAKAVAEMDRAQRAEAKVARLEAQVDGLEGDLEAALSDLHRIADVITGSLPALGRR